MLRKIALSLLFVFAAQAQAKSKVKFAIITPEGSTWTNHVNDMAKEIKSATNNDVKFKVYAGGVSGDELDVLRKMKSNRMHAGAFSGVGLGVLVPEVRILEAPMLFQNVEQIDQAKEKLFKRFSDKFDKEGYVLLGFAEAGFVYLFSKQKIDTAAALKNIKMWVWKGDLVAETFMREFGIPTTPLHLADVNTGLETGMIDSFYAPPLAAVAFQWTPKAQYMLDYPFANSTGAVIMTKKTFEKLKPAQQQQIRLIVKKYCDKIIADTRKENEEARKVIAASGIKFVKPSEQDIKTFKVSASNAYKASIPKIYPQDLFNQVAKMVESK